MTDHNPFEGMTPYQRRKARMAQRGIARDYAREYAQAIKRAQAEGFRTPKERALFKRSGEVDSERWQKRRILDYFGISERRFNEIRRENRHYVWTWKQGGQLQFSSINVYRSEVDADIHNWSEERIGYIVSFHAAVVNKRSNYDSLTKTGVRILNPDGTRKSNDSQYFYLVKYAKLMQTDDYEARYGRTSIRQAMQKKVPTP